MGKMTKAQAVREITVAFGELANRLEFRASTCTYAVDADLHRKASEAIRALLHAYRSALEEHNGK